MEINKAVDKLQLLLASNKGNHFLAVHHSGSVVTQGPAQPKEPNEEIVASTDLDMFVGAAMDAATAEEATAAWRPTKQPKQLK